MKYLFFVLLLFIYPLIYSQQYEPCITSYKLVQQTPAAQIQLQQMQVELRNYINASLRADSSAILTVPVVFHIIHSGEALDSGLNISEAQIFSQIDVLNSCFNLRNADTVLIPNWFKSRKANVGIEFCLARFNPAGDTTTGITRHNFTNTTNFDNTIKPATQWDATKYLNIWTTDLPNSILGYSTFPNIGPQNQDGIVLDYKLVGRSPANPFNVANRAGKTAVHEVGHWLMLYHTFEDSCGGLSPQTCATQGDRICDTPPVKEATYGQPNLVQNSCTESPIDEYDMWMNYMDYADDDQSFLFTIEQSKVMRATLNTFRASIQSSLGCGVPTAISTIASKEDVFSFYPNPANSFITVNYKSYKEEPYTISLVNSLGQQIALIARSDYKTTETKLELNQFAEGLYFIHLKTANSEKKLKMQLIH